MKKILLIFLFLILFTAFTGFIFAQERELEVVYPQIPGAVAPETTATPLPSYLQYIYNFSIAIAGLVAFASLLYGGIRYMTSAGNVARMAEAKEQALGGVLGLALLFLSYLILVTINPQFLIWEVEVPHTPEIVVEPVDLTPPKLAPFTYQELPFGILIEKLLDKKRLEDIKEVSFVTKKAAKALKELTGTLKGLAEQCSCSNLDTGTCNTGSCANPSCVSNCHCSGDPCPNREDLNKKREEALLFSQAFKAFLEKDSKLEDFINENSAKINSLPGDLRDLIFEMKETENERGSLEKLKEDLAGDLGNLEKSERILTGCYGRDTHYNELMAMKDEEEMSTEPELRTKIISLCEIPVGEGEECPDDKKINILEYCREFNSDGSCLWGADDGDPATFYCHLYPY